jgi:hypothetical protein
MVQDAPEHLAVRMRLQRPLHYPATLGHVPERGLGEREDGARARVIGRE